MMIEAYYNGFGAKDAQGNAAPRMPEPYHFIFATISMSAAGLVALGNERLGVVLAWGMLLGAMVYNYEQGRSLKALALQNGNPSATQLGTVPAPIPAIGTKN